MQRHPIRLPENQTKVFVEYKRWNQIDLMNEKL